ncbi:ABC transporter substrate-binding protein [Gordonia soli]|uniref:ABC transporter substrate-binding protein n=1 Tax=Gordonia soli TaxID=320799 RepID=UPI001C3F2DD5|nr:ABC transporter substrate-binding protein [Gordonia soli]
MTVTDDFGRKVTLEKPAARVASTEWQQTEDLLTLCLTPVAVADTKGYAAYDTAEKLPHGVTDVGTRSEPDLDALAGVAPDLVIVEATAADDPRVTGLEKRGVKVLATKGADATDPVAHMRSLFTLIAEVTGRTDRADQVLTELDSHVDEARSKVMRAGLATRDFVYLDGWVEGGNVTIRPFGRGALFSALGERLGLTAAWNGQVDSTYGLGQTDLEGMIAVGDANLFYTATEDPTSDNYVTELGKSSIWANLPAVKEGRAKPFPPGIWTFGGPRSAVQAVDAYVDLLIAE